jgi:hypothetical protein
MKRILIVLFAGLIVPAGLIAQRVYKSGTKVILDLSVEAGMPDGAVTNAPKTWVGNPQNNGGPLSGNAHDGDINATVFRMLEIAPHDINTGDEIGPGTGSMPWDSGFTDCENATYDGGGWRLPTQRELMLMYIFKPALNGIFSGINATSITAGNYWSITELDAPDSFYVNFSTGETNSGPKISSMLARCVREVTQLP